MAIFNVAADPANFLKHYQNCLSIYKNLPVLSVAVPAIELNHFSIFTIYYTHMEPKYKLIDLKLLINLLWKFLWDKFGTHKTFSDYRFGGNVFSYRWDSNTI
jgi:hypothetical protein